MTFGKIRKIFGNTSKEGYYELYRLCGKEGITVIGGPSKLFKHFIENMKPIEVISYCHKDISNGNVYRKIGMQKEVEVGIGYSYWKQGLERRINRFSLRKDKVDDGSGRSAFDILDSQGYRRCYNSGTKKFIWNNQLT